eukprot:4772595-Prymnesium_polylepis.2
MAQNVNDASRGDTGMCAHGVMQHRTRWSCTATVGHVSWHAARRARGLLSLLVGLRVVMYFPASLLEATRC